MKKVSPPQTQRTHMADDVLRTRRMRREKRILCARSVSSVSAAVRCLGSFILICDLL